MKVDLALTNGAIYSLATLDSEDPYSTMLIKDGRIVSLKNSEYLSAKVKAKTIIDLNGATVTPGFIDAHAHLMALGLSMNHVNLGETKSIEEAIDLIKTRTNTKPHKSWIIAVNWDESRWKERRYITKEDLDQVSTEHYLVAWREDGHLVSLNSKALQKIVSMLPKTVSEYQPLLKDGVLKDLPPETIPVKETLSEQIQALEKAMNYALSLGVTTVHDIIKGTRLEAYLNVWKKKKLKLRVRIHPLYEYLDQVSALNLQTNIGDDWLQIGFIKLFADGSLGARTALLQQPYADDPQNSGLELLTTEELILRIKKSYQHGFGVCIHAIGDQAIENVLTTFEHTKEIWKSNLSTIGRPRIEHAEMLTDKQIKWVTALDIALCMQPNFLKWQREAGLYETRLGKARTLEMNPFKKILSFSIPLAFGSDCMPLSPLFGIKQTLTHPNKKETLTPWEAFYVYSAGTAKATGEFSVKGSLTPQKFADFIILNKNPFTTTLKEIEDLSIQATFVNGQIQYKTENFLI